MGSLSPLWEAGEHGVDPETEAGLARLSEPTGTRRELIRTSMIDARPEAVFTVPGPSYWPLVSAVALGVLLVGILVDAEALGAVGIAGTVVGLLGWLYPRPTRQDALDTGTTSSEVVLEGTGGRPEAWHGTLFGLASLGTILGALLYAYFYLSVTVEQWPPPGVPAPGLVLPGLVTLLLTGAGLPLWWAQSAPVDAGRTRARLGLAAVTVLGLVAGGLVMLAILGSGLGIEDHAYAGIFITVQAYFLVLLFAGLVVSLAVEYRLWKGGYDPHGRTSLQVAALVWWFLLLAWLTVWATLYLTPQLL